MEVPKQIGAAFKYASAGVSACMDHEYKEYDYDRVRRERRKMDLPNEGYVYGYTPKEDKKATTGQLVNPDPASEAAQLLAAEQEIMYLSNRDAPLSKSKKFYDGLPKQYDDEYSFGKSSDKSVDTVAKSVSNCVFEPLSPPQNRFQKIDRKRQTVGTHITRSYDWPQGIDPDQSRFGFVEKKNVEDTVARAMNYSEPASFVPVNMERFRDRKVSQVGTAKTLGETSESKFY